MSLSSIARPSYPVNPSSSDPQQSSPANLQTAIKNCDPAALARMDQLPLMMEAPLPNGELPLHYAVRCATLPTVQALLATSQASLLTEDDQGLHALDHAFLGDNDEIKTLLLQRFLNIGHTEAKKALDATLWNGGAGEPKGRTVERFHPTLNIRYREVSPPHKEEETKLFLAAIEGNHREVKELIESGVDLSIKDGNGRTALHLAAATGNLQTVQLLLQHQTDPLATDDSSTTPTILLAKALQKRAARKDPLQLSPLQVAMCLTSLTAWAESYYGAGTIPYASLLSSLAYGTSTLSALSRVDSLWSAALFTGTHALKSTNRYAALAARAYGAFSAASAAFSGLQRAWRNRAFDSARALRNAVVYSVTGSEAIRNIGQITSRTMWQFKEEQEEMRRKEKERQRKERPQFESNGQRFNWQDLFSWWTTSFPDTIQPGTPWADLKPDKIPSHARFIVGIEPGAKEKEIKKKCNKLYRKHHPDKQQGSEEKTKAQDLFSKLREACKFLTN